MVWLNVLLMIIGTALTAAILVQSRSAGMSGAFGGGAEGFHVRRGSEKTIFRLTIVLAFLFLATAIAHLFIR
ncbi:MAG: preprotein translocase subunit SecG [Candidatus Andersenbacteria bacterium CG10_big_fil_rev_8_21_14_0_10_54_11]|uniref:Protein-export membrane protein SecG n=1 Tax=Candidatus Andersenbacteria bacterium CG10_big_fil_rev_8_21_14_0_10_54_11 TaxID=1974485 RepID=A0A2M6WYL4_9BACT|nr:MAG: preprotein translocase subunit SecG [Candidatus Andersenbacteria bacterium CG10_big_fil_rev_8_21_14_0_10_54_11]